MDYTDKSCKEFVECVGMKTPIPGGGSVAALVGALGASLSTMVASLTIGKKKFIAVEIEMEKNIEEIYQIQNDLLELVQRDIDNFEPTGRKKRNQRSQTKGFIRSLSCPDGNHQKMRQGH